MSAAIINFPLTPLQAWNAYQRLLDEISEDHSLIDDPVHSAACARAFSTFLRVYTEAA